MKIEILFEDDYIIIVNKQNNLLIHNSYYARNIKEPTLLDRLYDQTGNNYYPAHRLDRKTSGVLMLAKKKAYIKDVQELFEKNTIQKQYRAIVRGFVNDTLIIKSPVKHPETKIYREANTTCIPLKKHMVSIPVHPYENARYSLVELIPKTGRIHQLRIHMNKVSHPIVGDYKYGDRFHNRMFEKEFACMHLFLHAYSLSFIHPFNKKELKVEAGYPNDWLKVFSLFGW